jgi:hypothetical protein
MDGNDGVITADRRNQAAGSAGAMDTAFAAMMTEICGADNVITDPQQLRT